MTSAMVAAGDCGYCGTHLPQAVEPPPVVHVTKVEVRGPDIQVAGLFDSVAARATGCFTGCLSMGVTVGITLAILAFSAWQVWITQRHVPTAPPAHEIEHPKPVRGKR
jgi:hypothetical protein